VKRRSVAELSLVCATLFFSLSAIPANAYRLTYKEQLYRLYHRQFYAYPLRVAENIVYLEEALKAPFANPLNALARVETEREYDKYRYLFNMQLNLLLIEEYLELARLYNKEEAYFFNYPWRRINIESLDRAESFLEFALGYWYEAIAWSDRAEQIRWINLEEIQHWEDQSFRIQNGDLDYERIIEDHLERVEEVRSEFIRMGRQ
jgi:hypothetical protein